MSSSFQQQRIAQKKLCQYHMQFCHHRSFKCTISDLGAGFQDPTMQVEHPLSCTSLFNYVSFVHKELSLIKLNDIK